MYQLPLLTCLFVTCSVVLKMMEPFIKYVLVHPSPSNELSHIGHKLQSELISIAMASLSHYHHSKEPSVVALQRSKTILKFFIRLIALLPTKSDHQLMSVASLMEKIIHLELEIHQSDKGHKLCEQNGRQSSVLVIRINLILFHLELIDMCFSYLCELTERGLPCHALFECLFSLFKSMRVCFSVCTV